MSLSPNLWTVYGAWNLFQSSPNKLDALLLTESGRPDDRIEAVITYDDVLKYIYTHRSICV